MNRREFYVSRSGDDLLHVLALVEKKPYEEVLRERLGKDEIMERLDQHPMSSLLLADKLAQEGGTQEQEASDAPSPEDGTKQGKRSKEVDLVGKALARIGQTVEETVRRLHAPLVNELKQLTTSIHALDQNKAGKGEVNGALKAMESNLMSAIGNQVGGVAAAVAGLKNDIPTEQSIVGLIKTHGVPKEAVREAAIEAANELLENLRKSVGTEPVAAGGEGKGKKGEQQAKDVALLKVAQANVRPVKVETAEKVFGVKLTDKTGAHIKVEVWNDPDAEDVNPDYVFDPEHLRVALFAMSKKPARNVFMFGETGTGKTEFARQLSARLGRRLFRVNFENGSDSYNFIGGERAKNATTVYQYGTFTLGLKHPGAIILLDELCFAKPGHVAALHATLEYEGALTITETGERVKRAEGVIIFAADNTNGTGDRTGRYDGLYTMNGALRRRFSYWMHFDFPPVELESDIIARKTGINIKASRMVVDLMKACRAAARTGSLADAPSLPHAIAFCELVQSGKPTRQAYEQSVVMATSPEYAEKLQELYAASFREDAFEKVV